LGEVDAARALLASVVVFLASSCTSPPSAVGTRCREPDRPCTEALGCVGGTCLALTGGPLLCESHATCQAADPRRPFCVGTHDDRPFVAETYLNNFCAGCGSDADCDDSVCVQGETNWYCIGCVDGAQCDTGRCTKNVCRSCKSDAQCPNGQCVDGRCLNCDHDDDCPSTGLCRDGVCRSCRDASDCCTPGRLCDEWRCDARRCLRQEASER
jgi:hypothetical protein